MRLIDADEAVRAVHDEFDECLVWDESGTTTANEFENIILQIPTVDAEPIKHGKWIPVTKGALEEIYICNQCHRQIKYDGIPALIPQRYPYCHCGAKMDEVEEDENL